MSDKRGMSEKGGTQIEGRRVRVRALDKEGALAEEKGKTNEGQVQSLRNEGEEREVREIKRGMNESKRDIREKWVPINYTVEKAHLV